MVVLDKAGSLVLWTNCDHPGVYKHHRCLETAPPKRPVWGGDSWDVFDAGDLLELKNRRRLPDTAAAMARR
ncbi:MAG: hypothetical protein QOE41_1593 [Mycobacterium sp.]|jgi:hypothetical protein|nr:hypothetical protein [Mycobacterium sp.]